MYDYEHGDVEYTAHITLAEATNGTQRAYAFHTPEGHPYSVHVDIPQGIRTNDYVVVAGYGGPAKLGTHRGNLWIKVQIVTPDLITIDQHSTAALALVAAATRQFHLI